MHLDAQWCSWLYKTTHRMGYRTVNMDNDGRLRNNTHLVMLTKATARGSLLRMVFQWLGVALASVPPVPPPFLGVLASLCCYFSYIVYASPIEWSVAPCQTNRLKRFCQ